MPFGKYKDKELSQIPSSYLDWCLNNIKFKSFKLKEAVQHELLDRAQFSDDLEEDGHRFGFDDDSDEIPF